jgi:putative nucleotidyltransferase with HDIG domain
MTSRLDVKLDHLPVLPAVVVRLMGLAPGSDSYFEEVLSVSSEDPGLAVRVIHAANSALSAPRQPIETLQGAVARLGAAHIGNLVTAMAVTQAFVPKTHEEVDLWIHAVEVAAACRLMVANAPFGVDQHHAYLCGLLHDIGRFVMFDAAPELLHVVDAGGWVTPNELIASERRIFGYDHTDIGQQLCGRWNIPRRIATIIHDHHRHLELKPPVSPDERLAAIVEMADRLSVLARTGALEDAAADREALVAVISESCVDPEWTAPPISPAILAGLVPQILQAARNAVEHLSLDVA